MLPRFLITGNNKLLEIDLSNPNHGDHHFDVNGRSYFYEKYMWDDSEKKSLYCHQSCYKLLKKELGYNLTIADVEHKLDENSLLPSYGKMVDKFTRRQDFPWINMILNKNLYQSIQTNKKIEINAKNVSFLMNPLKNKDNKERILMIWKPIVHKIQKKRKIDRHHHPLLPCTRKLKKAMQFWQRIIMDKEGELRDPNDPEAPSALLSRIYRNNKGHGDYHDQLF